MNCKRGLGSITAIYFRFITMKNKNMDYINPVKVWPLIGAPHNADTGRKYAPRRWKRPGSRYKPVNPALPIRCRYDLNSSNLLGTEYGSNLPRHAAMPFHLRLDLLDETRSPSPP